LRYSTSIPARAFAALLVASMLACSKHGSGGGQPSGRGQGGGPGGGLKRPPMPVEVAPVEQGPMLDRFAAVGTIEAGEAIEVVSEIDGVVVGLPFREGEPVRAGALLAQLDDVTLRAELARAEALRDQTRTTWERVKSVVDQAAGAPQDLDDAAAALKVAEANLELAQARLAKTRILAPWAGIVGARRVSPGAFLRAGQSITDLASIREIKVSFAAPERYLSLLGRGTPVSVSTAAYRDETLTGRIDVVEPVLDPRLRSARVLARVPNPERKLRPGMSADVTVVLAERTSALAIPSEAVFVEGGQAFVYVVHPDSSVGRVGVTLGSRTAERVEVTAGLEAGTQVVRAGHQKLFPGARVMPISSGGAAPEEGAAR
jgi:membrane fusion protein (multidrug efflux system)